MSLVGWDPEGIYTDKEVESFAQEAMKKLKELGKDPNVELAEFGTTAF